MRCATLLTLSVAKLNVRLPEVRFGKRVSNDWCRGNSQMRCESGSDGTRTRDLRRDRPRRRKRLGTTLDAWGRGCPQVMRVCAAPPMQLLRIALRG